MQFSFSLLMIPTFTIKTGHLCRKPATFFPLCNIQNLPQNLKKGSQKLAFSVVIYAVINLNGIACRLCAGNKEHSERLYLRAAMFVRPLSELILTGQCLWKFLTSQFWLFGSICHASVKTQI